MDHSSNIGLTFLLLIKAQGISYKRLGTNLSISYVHTQYSTIPTFFIFKNIVEWFNKQKIRNYIVTNYYISNSFGD